jgi:hypothetical protein
MKKSGVPAKAGSRIGNRNNIEHGFYFEVLYETARKMIFQMTFSPTQAYRGIKII